MSRNRNGWGGILGSEDLTEDYDRTDPNVEMPAFGDVGSEEKTTIAHHPTLERKRPQPKLTLPRPESDREEQPPPAFAVEVDQIVQKLEPEKKAAPGKKKEDSIFTKEVILTLIGGVVLLAGAVVYTRAKDEAPVQTELAPPPPIAPPKAPPQPQPPPPKVEAPPVSREPAGEETRKATTPILSILSNPSGARVEIDGTIYGTTPLIQPGPSKVKRLSIRLLKDNYKIYETVLTPNEAGHFNLNATLEKR
jgi:hypothetical protein